MQPPVAAEVDVHLLLADGSDPETAVESGRAGRANRFGYLSLTQPEIELDRSGEYRVDIVARQRDATGIERVGALRWGSVVETPGSALVTHGRRGFDVVERIQDQWFFASELEDMGQGHLMPPFHRGDVMWMLGCCLADSLKLSVQDPQGDFAARVRRDAARVVRAMGQGFDPPSLEERITAGEIPLFSTTSLGLHPTDAWDRTDRFGYFYGSAVRPGVRVRQAITEDVSPNTYWRFDDTYNRQLGVGFGDAPNDFKFHFGGAVYRDESDGFRLYGAYGSLFVLLPSDDEGGDRVFPPFQGAAGGPSGGPLMTLLGEEIEIFLHPTGVRAGTLLDVGNVVSRARSLRPLRRECGWR